MAPGIPANYGAHRMGSKNKPNKVDVLKIAMGTSRILSGSLRTDRGKRALGLNHIPRPKDLDTIDYVMGDAATGNARPSMMFPALGKYGVPHGRTRSREFRAEGNREQETFSETGAPEVDEMVSLQSLRRYRDHLIHRRQDALEAFIQIHERSGAIDDRGVSTLLRIYDKG